MSLLPLIRPTALLFCLGLTPPHLGEKDTRDKGAGMREKG